MTLIEATNPVTADIIIEPTQIIPASTQLEFVGGIRFGSSALGVTYAGSDIDIAILKSQFEAMEVIVEERNINNYFKVSPAYGSNMLLRGWSANPESKRIDVLLLEYPEHLKALNLAVQDLKLIDKSILRNKVSRIHLFEEALVKRGYTKKNYFLRIKRWVNKH